MIPVIEVVAPEEHRCGIVGDDYVRHDAPHPHYDLSSQGRLVKLSIGEAQKVLLADAKHLPCAQRFLHPLGPKRSHIHSGTLIAQRRRVSDCGRTLVAVGADDSLHISSLTCPARKRTAAGDKWIVRVRVYCKDTLRHSIENVNFSHRSDPSRSARAGRDPIPAATDHIRAVSHSFLRTVTTFPKI